LLPSLNTEETYRKSRAVKRLKKLTRDAKEELKKARVLDYGDKGENTLSSH
jgi:hypothetical protein